MPSLTWLRAQGTNASTPRELVHLPAFLTRTRLQFVAGLLAPLVLVFGFDLINRSARIATFSAMQALTYVASSVLALLLWSSLLVLASARHGRVRHAMMLAAPLLAATIFGCQRYFYQQYGTYLNADAARFGASVGTSVLNQLYADGANFSRYLLPPALVATALVILGRRLTQHSSTVRSAAGWLFPITLAAALVLPCSHNRVQAASPDVIFLHAVGRAFASRTGLSKEKWAHPTARKPQYLPALASVQPRPRNVVFIISESLRADIVCSVKSETCAVTPFTNAALPQRIGLSQLRAVDSTTAISLAVLWSGLSPVAPSPMLNASPLLWDFAAAAGFETAYITSQNLAFANARSFVQDLPLKHRCEASDLDTEADLDTGAPDEAATARALHDIADMREPFFAVVHYANTHFPYRIDPSRAPFAPYTDSKDPARNTQFMNFYRNAVYLQDIAIANLVRGLQSMPHSERTVLVFTADHGEAFREHYQLGHTGSIYDEEIHVPGWVQAPPGTLSPDERLHLESASDAPTWHIDIAPTILDLLGIWDSAELTRHRAQMPGTSLLRGVTRSDVAITNCSAIWDCPFRNWGMMRGHMKLEAREWDATWHCFDLAKDPRETHDLGVSACESLARAAHQQFGRLPRDP